MKIIYNFVFIVWFTKLKLKNYSKNIMDVSEILISFVLIK